MHSESFSYGVEFSSGECRWVHCTEVAAKSRLWQLDLTHAQPFLKWGGDQRCTFIDSAGCTRYFRLQFPLAFSEQSSSPVGPVAWPLMMYLHGAAGKCFFGHSKKSLKTIGVDFAARNFIVVGGRGRPQVA